MNLYWSIIWLSYVMIYYIHTRDWTIYFGKGSITLSRVNHLSWFNNVYVKGNKQSTDSYLDTLFLLQATIICSKTFKPSTGIKVTSRRTKLSSLTHKAKPLTRNHSYYTFCSFLVMIVVTNLCKWRRGVILFNIYLMNQFIAFLWKLIYFNFLLKCKNNIN